MPIKNTARTRKRTKSNSFLPAKYFKGQPAFGGVLREDLVESNHYQVEPDTWVYLFRDKNEKKYVLIDADYINFDFEAYPHLLRFDNGEFTKLDFVLQREVPVKDGSSREKASGTFLFEYTD